MVAYLTAGDPNLEASEKIILAAAEAGADVIELGVPFSDPVADGPTIQRASERALTQRHDARGRARSCAARLRARTEVPFVLFSYFNPILQMGLEKFAQAAAQRRHRRRSRHGHDSGGIGRTIAASCARTSSTRFSWALPLPPTRASKQIAACSSGFVYLISRTGVTGTRESLPEELPALVRRVRHFTPLPIAVGFGISQPAHVSSLAGWPMPPSWARRSSPKWKNPPKRIFPRMPLPQQWPNASAL